MENYGFLYVRTMGGFSITWNDKPIRIGLKGEDTQFVRLIQILLHNYKSGVGRSQLQNLLSSDSNADDAHHLFRTVLYNARKRFRLEGLPDIPYIVYRNGLYCWTEQIPVKEDAEEFEQLCVEALNEKNRDTRFDKLLRACDSYGGEFLPNQTRLAWVAEEDNRYKKLFGEVVEKAAAELRKRGDYTGLERLGRQAAARYPLSEKEIITLEGLSGNGRFIEAQNYFYETVDYYQKELGVNPSFGMMSKLEKIAKDFVLPQTLPEMIVKQLPGAEDGNAGGYMCTYPVFKGITGVIKRNKERLSKSCYLLICTLETGGSTREISEKTMDKLCLKMENALVSSVRKGDAVCRYGRGQYLVLLMNLDRKSCDIVIDRVNSCFGRPRGNYMIDYHIEAL